jgi:NADPH:quinone reductase-like Zn-dependent oxidoreductase
MLTKKGGPEVLKVVELPIEHPGPGQLRARVLAAGIGSTDLSMLTGTYMYAPKLPFVPGYEVAGVVEAIGHGVKGFELDQRVAAHTVYGGFAELLAFQARYVRQSFRGCAPAWPARHLLRHHCTVPERSQATA